MVQLIKIHFIVSFILVGNFCQGQTQLDSFHKDIHLLTANISGNNGYKDFYLVELQDSQIFENSPTWKFSNFIAHYAILTPDKELVHLNVNLDTLNSRIEFYEIKDSSIFIMINYFSVTDWVRILDIDIRTGQTRFSLSGEVPCTNHNPNRISWTLGNEDCEWINHKTKQVALFVRSRGTSTNKVYSYNWKTGVYKILSSDIPPAIDAGTGRNLMLKNTRYNQNSKQFEYPGN